MALGSGREILPTAAARSAISAMSDLRTESRSPPIWAWIASRSEATDSLSDSTAAMTALSLLVVLATKTA